MTFPAGLTLVTVTCTFDTLPDGGASGIVQIFYDGPLTGGADNSIVPYVDVTGVLVAGTCDLDVPANNDPGWIPQNFAYTVRATVGGRTRTGSLQLDYQTTAVNLADLVTWDGAVTSGTSYIALSQRGVADGVAALDADGDVTDASGAKITGGGGGGVSPSGTVVAETSFGASSSAGNATAYSRGNHTHGTPTAPTAASVGADASGTAASAVAAHAADTTAVHGITDTADLVLTGDSRLTNARTPTAHASSHADGGADEVSLDGSQVTGGTVGLARLPTGTSSSTVALGDAPAAAVTTHEAAANPHAPYRRTYFETTGTYALVSNARDFIGADDPAGEGFTLADGDKWYEIP
jgi:hypothetical protein